jgi:DamX protein
VSRNNQNLDYKTILGLQRDPFSPEPDPLFYFPVVSFEQRLALLKRLVQGKDVLVLVIGEPGGGKTTLLKRYLNTTDKMWAPGRLQTSPASDLQADSQAPTSHPAYVLLDSEDPVVIVDDAHTLSAENLVFLLRDAIVPGSAQIIKRLILFGEAGLYNEMTSLTESFIGNTSVNKIYLPSLTTKETAAYLQHRLQVAGYTGEKLFDSSTVKEIHQVSGGLPGPMNEIADQKLKKNYANKKKRRGNSGHPKARSKGIFGWVGAGLVVILLVALALFMYRQTRVAGTQDSKVAKKIYRADLAQKPQPSEKIFRGKIPSVKRSITSTIQPTTTSIVNKKIEPQQQTGEQPKKIEPPQQAQEQVVSAQSEKLEPVPKADLQTASVQPEEKIEPQEKMEQPQKDVPKQPIVSPAVAEKTTETVIEVVAEKSEKEGIHREDWLLSKNSEHYTIQIMGVSNEDSLLNFIKTDQLLDPNRLAYYKAAYKRKNWYPLLYGVYATKKEARVAANELPDRFRKASPWIRKIESVQKEIQID